MLKYSNKKYTEYIITQVII